MKKISTLLASFILTISLFAADRPKSTLIIKSYDQGDIRVVVDGRRFEPYGNTMRIADIRPGYHSVKVYRMRNIGIFTIFGQRYDMVFNNSVMVTPRSSTMISIDRFGRSTVMETGGGRGWGANDGGWNQSNDLGYDRGSNEGDYGARDRNKDDRWNTNDGRNGEHSHDGNYDNRGGSYGNGGYDNRGGYGNDQYSGKVMNDNEFGRVLDNISKERFENNMMKSASQVISTSYFTSSQVRQMLQLFSFENNKLELANRHMIKQ
jgi:hypothetical protein